jgi:phenylalanyl-tRNA synthetase alpha chain
MDVLSPLEIKLLVELEKHNGIASPDEIDMELVKVMNAASWLQSKGLIQTEEKLVSDYKLTEEGATFLKKGLPEKKLIKKLKKSTFGAIEKTLGKKEAKISIGWAKKKGWCDIVVDNTTKYLIITDKGIQEKEKRQPEEEALEKIKNNEFQIDKNLLKTLLKRGAITEKETIQRVIKLTPQGTSVLKEGLTIEEEISQVTPEIIKNKEWKTKKFRKYDVNAFAPSVYPGKQHPLTQLMKKIRRVFSDMGFKEIKGTMIEPCFWNMDALFIPQDHPARDMQDTFYCKNPNKIDVSETLIKKIAKVHEDGGTTGSRGWGYKFDKNETKRPLLRTHSTVNTLRYLAENPDPPSKIFSIERVFRRENIDTTHLPEFYQIEGIVYEKQANFCMLKGLLKEFYQKIGFENIRFRPAYFPYTEPSLEIEIQWNNKWIELGGAGIFRPEVTLPFNLKEPVLAWGLGLERIAMILLDLNDIRMLYFSDISWLKELPFL